MTKNNLNIINFFVTKSYIYVKFLNVIRSVYVTASVEQISNQFNNQPFNECLSASSYLVDVIGHILLIKSVI